MLDKLAEIVEESPVLKAAVTKAAESAPRAVTALKRKQQKRPSQQPMSLQEQNMMQTKGTMDGVRRFDPSTSDAPVDEILIESAHRLDLFEHFQKYHAVIDAQIDKAVGRLVRAKEFRRMYSTNGAVPAPGRT